MFGPDYKAGCPSLLGDPDGFDGIAVHLSNHDVMLWAVSRAPLAKLQAYNVGWAGRFPGRLVSAATSNFDFNVSFTEEQQREGIEYNYQTRGTCRGDTVTLDVRRSYEVRGYEWNRREHIHAREAGHERVRARGRRGLPHLFPPIRAESMACGECISGSIARQRGATRQASGGVATTSTTRAESERVIVVV